MLRNATKARRLEIETSAYYVGYRLLWILGLFLKGKKFPNGQLDTMQFKVQVFNIVDFVTDEDNLSSMLDFDSEALFDVLVALFNNEPWLFITNPGKYKFKFQRNAIAHAKEVEELQEETKEAPALCNIPVISGILNIFKEASFRAFRKESAFTKHSFKEFIIKILIESNKENELANSRTMRNYAYHKLEIDYDLAFDALKMLFKIKRHGDQSVVADKDFRRDLDEELLIKAIEVVPLKEEHIEEILELCDAIQEAGSTVNTLTEVKIKLYEKKKDYYQAFMQYLNNEGVRKNVFMWVNSTFEKLK